MSILFKETFFLRTFAFAKIPLLFYIKPSVVRRTEAETVIMIPFLRRNRNHLNSMYFGTLCIGADIAGGYIVTRLMKKERKRKPSLVFKDFQARFLRRPEGDTHFTCKDGLAIQAAIERAKESMERVEVPVQVVATVPMISGDEPVAEFNLTLSLRFKA